MRKSVYLRITFQLSILFLLFGCNENKTHKTKSTLTKEVIASTKLCGEIKYKCLTLSKDEEWRKKLLSTEFEFTSWEKLFFVLDSLEDLYNKNQTEDFYASKEYSFKMLDNVKGLPLKEKVEIGIEAAFKKASEVLHKSKEEIMKDKVYVMSYEEHQKIEYERKIKIYNEITEMLELFYPGFWGDTPKKEQLQWVQQAERKKDSFPTFGQSRGNLEVMCHICAILGIDFDTKPKLALFTKMLTHQKYALAGWNVDLLNYLYFVYLERDYDVGGGHFNTWSLRGALGNLPQPERHVPVYPDELIDGRVQNFDYSIQRIYKDTIREGGRSYDPKDHEVIRAYMNGLKPVNVRVTEVK